MPVREYNSSDAGAPALTGQVGSLIALLDAVLVNGYGSTPGAGWTKLFSGTNRAVYRMGGGNQMVLQVLDDAPGAAGALEARLRGAESASDVSTLVNPFPTTAQLSAGIIVRKSSTLDAVARSWYVIADASTFWLLVRYGGTVDWRCGFGFGGFVSRVANDPGRTFILGRIAENDSTDTPERFARSIEITNVLFGHYLARLHTGVVGSEGFGKHADASMVNSLSMLADSTAPLAGTNPSDNRFWLSRVYVTTPSPPTLRGQLRGLMQICHAPSALADGAVVTGASGGPYAGKQFRIRSPVFGGTTANVVAFEISDTWEPA